MNSRFKLTGWAGGLNELEEHQTLPHLPQRAFRTNAGSYATPATVFEDQTLVGYMIAPQSVGESLDLCGIDVSYATFDQLKRRWTGCFFSEQVADMLVELSGEVQSKRIGMHLMQSRWPTCWWNSRVKSSSPIHSKPAPRGQSSTG